MRSSRSVRKRALAALGVGAAVLAVSAAAQPANAAQSRRMIAGTSPRWLSSARDEGSVSASTRIEFGILLKLRNQSQAVAKLAAVSKPTSATYGKWLSNSQFVASYAPTRTQVGAVQSWLKGQGFAVRKTLPSGLYIEASGTAAQVQKTFATTLHSYRYGGRTVRANVHQLSLPSGTSATVSNAVSGVLGIDQGAELKKPASTVLPGPPDGFRTGVQPCSHYYGQKIAYNKPKAYGKHRPYAVCGYGPSQLQSVYGEKPLLKRGITGKGVTVAITDAYASPTMLQDAQTYSRRHGQPVFRPGQYREIRPSKYNVYDPVDAQGWYGEETLDVEAVHGMAPGAKVVFVSGSDDLNGLTDAWAEAIDNHVADIITNSWTDAPDAVIDTPTLEYFYTFALEAALTGITDNFSTGDDGDLTVGGTAPKNKDVEFPADIPWVTGVGGTSVAIGRTGNRIAEFGWSNSYSPLVNGAWTPTPPGVYSSGGGGGTSTIFPQPFYQKGKVPTSLSEANGPTPARVIPDISLIGDPNTGMRVGETQVFPNGTYYDEYRIGGTSVSSPVLAGAIAVADQYAGHSLGFVNPLYYQLLHTPALYDEVAPKHPVAQVRTDFANGVDASDGLTFKLQTLDYQGTSLHDTRGYDDETGVGSPSGPLFFLGLALAGHARY